MHAISHNNQATRPCTYIYIYIHLDHSSIQRQADKAAGSNQTTPNKSSACLAQCARALASACAAVACAVKGGNAPSTHTSLPALTRIAASSAEPSHTTLNERPRQSARATHTDRISSWDAAHSAAIARAYRRTMALRSLPRGSEKPVSALSTNTRASRRTQQTCTAGAASKSAGADAAGRASTK